MIIELKLIQTKHGNMWHAKADFTNDEWTMTPFSGFTQFEHVAGIIRNLNRGYDVIEAV